MYWKAIRLDRPPCLLCAKSQSCKEEEEEEIRSVGCTSMAQSGISDSESLSLSLSLSLFPKKVQLENIQKGGSMEKRTGMQLAK